MRQSEPMQDDDGRLVEAIARAIDPVAFKTPIMTTRRHDAMAAASAALWAIEREGWKVVPVEPTEAMIEAGRVCDPLGCDVDDEHARAVYRGAWFGMLSAAPKQG